MRGAVNDVAGEFTLTMDSSSEILLSAAFAREAGILPAAVEARGLPVRGAAGAAAEELLAPAAGAGQARS
ncbi:MAG: hypothetical protein GIW99_07850 [Candidatus Eremiobacteraeota bacterium]|nr:hypothetical protein [Candidatus Eremiobacteraeota bacterium]MBC5827575.1 hypothetical protein [Candidatus Eremiobacteraeota bacterium]